MEPVKFSIEKKSTFKVSLFFFYSKSLAHDFTTISSAQDNLPKKMQNYIVRTRSLLSRGFSIVQHFGN